MVRICSRAWLAALPLLLLTARAEATSPWELLNFKRVEADPHKDYELSERNGPWMIMVATFTGDGAADDAHNLVLDLRKNFKLNAFRYEKTYDFTKSERGLGLTPDGRPKMMHHMESRKLDEIAVLIGDFTRVDDPEAQAVLKKLKQAQPDSIKKSKSLAFADYRHELSQNGAPTRGPLSRAFIVTNPLISSESFAPRGVDKFVLEMNRDVEHSLLDCPGKYSVIVATFKGNSIIDQQKIREVQASRRDMKTQLDVAADRAHRMTVELRKLGYEAYEFHDRESSIVTVGNFDAIGTTLSDGTIEPTPRIKRIIEVFGPIDQKTPEPGQTATGLMPQRLQKFGPNSDLVFDVQPTPVEVPKRSVATDYARPVN
ncbi:MAG TPA: hypothetical protein VFE24_13365 [Pirellulales bacterium]|jgi:hypothetical protein|nr:hypothetical protein [Pirellulales bacterium]